MKLLSKIALFFVLVGVVLSVTGLALGANTAIHWNQGFHIGQNSGRLMDFSFENDFSHLDLDISTGNLRIEHGETFRLFGTYHGQNLQIDEQGNTLSIRSERNRQNRGTVSVGVGFFRSEQNQLTLTIPRNADIDTLNAIVSLGNVDIANIEAANAFIWTSAGNITCRNINFTNATFESGAGNIDVSGVLWGNCRISSGAGNIWAQLDMYEEEISWSANTAVGNVRHNGQNVGRHSSSRVQAANLHLDISVGAGNIDFSFR